MDTLKTHISISCDVYPELFAKLNAISNPHKRAELLKTLAEDGRRWRDGTYTQAPIPQADTPIGATSTLSNSDGTGEDGEFRLPELALEDAKEIGW